MAQQYVDPPANALNPGAFKDAEDYVETTFTNYDFVNRINKAAEAWSQGDRKTGKTLWNGVVLASKKDVDPQSGREEWRIFVRRPGIAGEPDPPLWIPLEADTYAISQEHGHEKKSSWNQISMHQEIAGVAIELLDGSPPKPKDIIKFSTNGEVVHFLGRMPSPSGLWDRLHNKIEKSKPPTEAAKSPDLPTKPEKGTVARSPSGLESITGDSFKHAVDRSAPVTNGGDGQPVKANEINAIVLQESETYAKETSDLKSGGRNEMHRVLTGKKLSVHFSIGLDGSIVEHEDPKTRVTFHSGGKVKANYGIDGRSIGIEIINRVRRCSGDDSAEVKDGQPACKEVDNKTVFNVKFNGYGEYRNPPLVQLDAVYKKLAELEDQYPGLELDFDLTSKNFLWGNNPSINDNTAKGVVARGEFLKSYSDGLAVKYYCICRARGYTKQQSYEHLVTALKLLSSATTTTLPKSLAGI